MINKKVSENTKIVYLDLEMRLNDKNNFIDNLHFTKLGCDKFSSMLHKNIDKYCNFELILSVIFVLYYY